MIDSQKNKTAERGRTAILSTAVTAVFCIIVTALLLINQLKTRDLLDNPELTELKNTLRKDLSNDPLKEEIRILDQEIREEMLYRRSFRQVGSWILLAGIVAFLISAKSAMNYRKQFPMPQPGTPQYKTYLLSARLARWSVVVLAVVIAVSSLWLIVGFPSGMTGMEPQKTAQEESPPDTPPAVYSQEEFHRNWPCFRGPQGLGISAYSNIPTQWDVTTGDGIVWKTEVPLPGQNSPVVWNNYVFLTGATKEKRAVFCFDTTTGQLLWQGDVANIPGSPVEVPNIMEDTGYAAPTAAADGSCVFAIFPNGDVACFDFRGKPVWSLNLGLPDSMYGYASSLAIHKELVIIQYDQGSIDDGLSALIALHTQTGKEVWRKERPVSASWTSPIIAEIENTYQIITVAPPWVIAYHAITGDEIWKADCVGGDVAPSPIYTNGLVFAIEPYSYLCAIRANGRGDVTETHIAWKAEDGIPDICSPVSNGELVFLLDSAGLLTCYNINDGSLVWEHELDIYFHSSPSLVEDKLYLLSDEGEMIIIEAASEYKEVGRATLGEKSTCCPAFLDGRIYIRGEKHLFCIGNP
jgi:outer membrane protein assembly factor BamB